jgi:hypothetical protein
MKEYGPIFIKNVVPVPYQHVMTRRLNELANELKKNKQIPYLGNIIGVPMDLAYRQYIQQFKRVKK